MTASTRLLAVGRPAAGWRWAVWALWAFWVGAVLAAHALLLAVAPVARIGPGAADRPPRIAVSFVQTLVPTAPPAAPSRTVRAPPRPAQRMLQAFGAPASAPLTSEAAGALTAEVPALAEVGVTASAASEPLAALSEVSTTPAAPVEWPPSTLLRYHVLGQFRGPAEGEAEVQWRRSGSRYEVQMNLSIGPRFAPLASRTVRSEGEITGQGLMPQRYDEETRALFAEPRRLAIELGDREIRLPNGQRVERPDGVQDSASQFVQLTWMFTADPARLTPGRSLELPLALPRRVEPWAFDVLGTETLSMAAGSIEAVHVKPRREARPGGDLTAEVWIAPTLQYLPVRILIRQSAEVWLDLTLLTWPEQAASAPR